MEIWFQDEARVGQRGTITRVWGIKGKRTRLKRQGQFLWVYLFGAVCPSKDKAIGLILPLVNTDMMTLHLEAISQAVEAGKHAVILVDRAGWHTTKKLKLPNNISLMPLPARAPELNPVEQVWQVQRQRELSNRVFDDYEAIVDACEKAWNNFVSIENSVKKLCTRSWIEC